MTASPSIEKLVKGIQHRLDQLAPSISYIWMPREWCEQVVNLLSSQPSAEKARILELEESLKQIAEGVVYTQADVEREKARAEAVEAEVARLSSQPSAIEQVKK